MIYKALVFFFRVSNYYFRLTGSGGTTDDADGADRGDAAPPACKKPHTPTNPTASASAGPMDGGGVECEPVSQIECKNKLILSAPRHTM